MREKTVEAKLVKAAKLSGGLAPKFIPGLRWSARSSGTPARRQNRLYRIEGPRQTTAAAPSKEKKAVRSTRVFSVLH